ncbi:MULTISPECIES: hypothetical protein [unclassified Limnothrix]|nr:MULTISPECIES: hypothetical protein [unclassified Limnothrix]
MTSFPRPIARQFVEKQQTGDRVTCPKNMKPRPPLETDMIII